ncbi:hypothetical protein A9Q84_15455 [Halobacteriovorax marinus]|uniref:DUF4423 domain-containing protein n=1 Tax=Halobacteriovorax marinus TaxID=97084 RepID=A0A1Y5F3U7_9BACT|nr:hypothetical protein A9Q84_15455 [Halobacteriovorax marinus]
MKIDYNRELSPIGHIVKFLDVNKEISSLYSLRSLAKSLDTAPGGLSLVISGKRNLNVLLANKISKTIFSSPQDMERFVSDVRDKIKTRTIEKNLLNLISGGINEIEKREEAVSVAVETIEIRYWFTTEVVVLITNQKKGISYKQIQETFKCDKGDLSTFLDELVQKKLMRLEDGDYFSNYTYIIFQLAKDDEELIKAIKSRKMEQVISEKPNYVVSTVMTSRKKLKEVKRLMQGFSVFLSQYLTSPEGEDEVVFTLENFSNIHVVQGRESDVPSD